MLYISVDFHKKYSFITEMDESGNINRQIRVSNDRDSLTGYINKIPPKSKVAIEATCNWYYFYELVEEHDIDVSLSHPLKTKANRISKD